MFWNKNPQKLCAVCDIGSASVSVALVLFSPNAKPKIVHSARIPVSIQTTPETELESAVLRYFDTACTVILKQKSIDKEFEHLPKKIEETFVFFSSPWFVSKTKTVLLQKDKPFLLKKDSIETLVGEEEQKFQSDVLSGLYEHAVKCETIPIEREIVRVKLNGYETVNPYMKEAMSAELTLFLSLARASIVSGITQLSEKHFHTKRVYSHTFPLASFGAVRSLYPHETNFTLVDIAGEMTDVTTVQSSVITGTQSFPIGRNTLVRKVCDLFGISSEIACSFLEMYQTNTLDTHTRENIEKTIHEFTAEWKNQIDTIIKNGEHPSTMSFRIFLTCDNEIRSIIVTKIQSEVQSGEQASVISLSAESCGRVLEYAKHTDTDPFIALETSFLSIHGFV